MIESKSEFAKIREFSSENSATHRSMIQTFSGLQGCRDYRRKLNVDQGKNK